MIKLLNLEFSSHFYRMNYFLNESKPLTAPRIDSGCMLWRDEKNHLRVITRHAYLTSLLNNTLNVKPESHPDIANHESNMPDNQQPSSD